MEGHQLLLIIIAPVIALTVSPNTNPTTGNILGRSFIWDNSSTALIDRPTVVRAQQHYVSCITMTIFRLYYNPENCVTCPGFTSDNDRYESIFKKDGTALLSISMYNGIITVNKDFPRRIINDSNGTYGREPTFQEIADSANLSAFLKLLDKEFKKPTITSSGSSSSVAIVIKLSDKQQ